MFQRLSIPVLGMPRMAKRLIVLGLDAALCLFTVWAAFALRLDSWVHFYDDPFWRPWAAALISVAIALPLFVLHGLYRAIFRYTGLLALMAIVKAVAIYALLFSTVITVIGLQGVPRTIGIIQPVLLLVLVLASRLVARYWLGGMYQQQLKLINRPKVLVYGAGNAGRQLVAAMANSHDMRVVGFLDDDERLHGHSLNGQPIYRPEDLPVLTETLGLKAVLLAIPSASRQRRLQVLELVQQAHVEVRTLPSVSEIAQGKVNLSDLRELDIDDLLGRDPVQPNQILLTKNIQDKVVMVTGAGGSIGSELCRQIVTLRPKRLVLFELSEYALYSILDELAPLSKANNVALVALLGSVRDADRMRDVMQQLRPETVYHAAAYKHVPLVEHNPIEGVWNNTVGTLNAAAAAAHAGVADFVLISTDKAVRPTNVMGASKRLAEMVLQAMAHGAEHKTRFSMVRFGNVLGSSGSVVPKFRQQIRNGGPITLTHPDMTRYFMSIPEAAQLVIQAGAMAKGGEVFVLDMGEPVRIQDLARRMVELTGLTVRDDANPEGDIDIEVVGLRPGEKLYEELLIGNNPTTTQHPRILQAQEDFVPWDQLTTDMTQLRLTLERNDTEGLRVLVEKLVNGYKPCGQNIAWGQKQG